MQPTKLLYLENFTTTQETANIIDIQQENDSTVIVLDQTIFYPQGGGQPYDQGTLQTDSATFRVEQVRFVDGIVKHIGHFEHGSFNNGDTVTCIIDQERRALHSRLHSAGHVIDMAVNALSLPWIPGKAYHFPEGLSE